MYHRQHPFIASIKERYLLSQVSQVPSNERAYEKIYHLTLDLKGAKMSYQPGDSVGVFPSYDREMVERTLSALGATGEELVKTKQGETFRLADFLTNKGNLTTVSPKLLQEVTLRQPDGEKKGDLEELQQESERDRLKAYLGQYEVWDFLLVHAEVTFTPQEFVDLLMPLLPRFYSISSSQRHVGDEMHLTVASFEYLSNGYQRRGVCTHYLCEGVELHQPVVPVFVQPSHGFGLPTDAHNTSLVMVGPGTGVAPFRAFLQERLLHAQSRGKHWLFFGEKYRSSHFFYEQDWREFSQKGHLRLDVAFSRDQEAKMYVQHKMWEEGQELYGWLEEGAYLYVCGDAEQMAKDVEGTLQRIVQEFGRKSEGAAKEYIKNLRKQKRYLRDVY